MSMFGKPASPRLGGRNTPRPCGTAKAPPVRISLSGKPQSLDRPPRPGQSISPAAPGGNFFVRNIPQYSASRVPKVGRIENPRNPRNLRKPPGKAARRPAPAPPETYGYGPFSLGARDLAPSRPASVFSPKISIRFQPTLIPEDRARTARACGKNLRPLPPRIRFYPPDFRGVRSATHFLSPFIPSPRYPENFLGPPHPAERHAPRPRMSRMYPLPGKSQPPEIRGNSRRGKAGPAGRRGKTG